MDATTSGLGKRKAPPTENADDRLISAAKDVVQLIPDVCWQLVSSFASPPDVYNLSLSSKHFFRPSNNEIGDDVVIPLAALLWSSTPLFATSLLRTSLLVSLRRVLQHSKSGITLRSVLKMPEGSLIAGSTMAQACLGVLWGEGGGRRRACSKVDVDLFCSAKAAPMVRSVRR